MTTRPLPRSMWFDWASPVLWNGQERNQPRTIVEMTDDERDTFWAAFELVGMDRLGEVPNG